MDRENNLTAFNFLIFFENNFFHKIKTTMSNINYIYINIIIHIGK